MQIAPTTRFGFSPPKATLLMSDVDESFVYGKNGNYHTDELAKTAEVIQQFQSHANQPFYVWWNTVRVLDSIKAIARTASLKPILNRFRLDGLIVNNGKQMFINAEKQPTADWIKSLDELSPEVNGPDTKWHKHIKSDLGWKQQAIDNCIRTALTQSGFQYQVKVDQKLQPTKQEAIPYALPYDDLRPSYEIWRNSQQPDLVLYYSPKHNTIRLAEWNHHNSHANSAAIKPIKDAILAEFKKATIRYEKPLIQQKHAHDIQSGNTLSLIRFSPYGVNKASTTQFALNHYIPAVDSIIVVGDDEPDRILLTAHYTQKGKSLPKAAIVCTQPGRDPKTSPIHPIKGINATSGDISDALTRAYQTLLNPEI